jgi:hypothetical protein
MKLAFKFTLAFVVLWFCGLVTSTAVYAEARQIYTDTIGLQQTNWTDSMSFPKFDPNSGILTGIEFVLDGRLEGSAQFESVDAEAATIGVGMAASVNLQRPIGAEILRVVPAASVITDVARFDGVIDFAGPSGRSFPRLIGIDIAESDTLSATADLALFTGEGSIDLPLVATGSANGSGGGNLALNYVTEVSALVTVTYIYQDAAIDLEKFTNGEDADDAPGVSLNVGDPVTWTYLVTNTGSVDLVEVTVTDDKEGPITCPSTTLAVGTTMICTLVSTSGAQEGQYDNLGTVTGKTPPDGVNLQRTVTDTDPSHYVASHIPVCPLDDGGQASLPVIEYLGSAPGTYVLPPAYEVFIVKRLVGGDPPFAFVIEPGQLNGNGERVYTATGPANRRGERAWACSGNCTFTPDLFGIEELGYLEPGLTIGAVLIDDDNDHRINAWQAEVNGQIFEFPIEQQSMVQYLVLEIPFAANWSFVARDSVGIVDICLAGPTAIWATAPTSSSRQNSPTDGDLISELFLPTVYSLRRE